MSVLTRAAGFQRLTTPRSPAAAGIVFALLFGTTLTLLRTAIPADADTGTDRLDESAPQLRTSLTLRPFAGIAFLLLIGVIRDRLGDYEDRFFATGLLGSGLLFLTMVFVATAIAGAAPRQHVRAGHRRTRAGRRRLRPRCDAPDQQRAGRRRGGPRRRGRR